MHSNTLEHYLAYKEIYCGGESGKSTLRCKSGKLRTLSANEQDGLNVGDGIERIEQGNILRTPLQGESQA